MRSLLLLTVFALISSVAQARTKFPFNDGADKDPSFAAFRAELQQIIADRDRDAFLSVVDENISFSFGGGAGKADFIADWGLDKNNFAQSGMWAELEKVLRFGGDFTEDGTFVAPYVSSDWPEGFDGYEYIAVVGNGVRVRAAASTDSEILYVASYEILQRGEYPAQGDTWTNVRTPDGQSGYIRNDFVSSPVDYRAFFNKNAQGQWLMRVFIAGD